jgi:hypothetical protein
MKMRHPDGNFVVSDGFDDGKTIPGLSSATDDLGIALCWFKDHFMKCNDRAALVKTWLPIQYDGPKSWLDQLVYDRALVLVGPRLLYRQPTYAPPFRAEQLLGRSSSTKRRARTNARSYMKNPCGAFTHFKTTYCRREIHSWMRIGKQSVSVRCLASSPTRACFDNPPCYRDQTHETAVIAVSCPNGHERPRSSERREGRPELG